MNKRDFSFNEIDVDGHETLDAISAADNFNQWMFDTISPFCEGKILEIGSGIGNISKYFLDAGRDITLTDIREEYCVKLKENFKEFDPPVLGINITDPEFDTKYADLFGSFDTVFSLNVVEHIKDDNLAIANCKKLLKQGGKLITLVPAYNCLYNGFDTALEHYRRYTKTSLKKLIAKEYKIIHTQYFNLIGIAGWFFSGVILGKKTIPKGQMGLYNKLVPIFKVIDAITFKTFGLSVIAVGVKE